MGSANLAKTQNLRKQITFYNTITLSMITLKVSCINVQKIPYYRSKNNTFYAYQKHKILIKIILGI